MFLYICMNSEQVMDAIKSYASKHCVPIADDPTTQYIEWILEKKRPIYCLEIGSAIWYSTVHIAQKISAWWGELISCEISYPSYRVCLDYIYCTLLSNIVVIHGNFLKFSHALCTHKFDFVFIDGNKAEYLKYYLHLQPLLATNSVLIFDDVIKYKSKVSPLIQYLDTKAVIYKIEQISKDDGILIIF